MPTPSIHVTFDTPDTSDAPNTHVVDFPITVEVSEFLFNRNGGNLSNMTEADKKEFNSFIQQVTPMESISEALTIIETAPQFDGIQRDEIDAPNVVASVTFDGFGR